MDAQVSVVSARRLALLIWVAFAWTLLIAGRLVWLQVFRHEDYLRQAEIQQRKLIEIPAARGSVFDRMGRPLAMSLHLDSVAVNPLLIRDRQTASALLARFLNLDPVLLYGRMQWAARNGHGFLWVKQRISPEESAKLRELGLDWIEFRDASQRYYPKGTLAAHLLGDVDFEEKGIFGLEMSLDGELQGKPGAARLLRDVKQRSVQTDVSSEPEPGTDLILSIDERIQFAAEKALAASAEANHCTTGSVVAMNPATGEILAFASYPSFDPNAPSRTQAELSARTNQALSVPFEPGSVFKVITIAAALEATSLTPESIIPCGNGRINLFGRVIHDHDPYSALSMADVLAKSSNIGAIQVGLRVGEAKLLEYVRRFGFGSRTGVPLPYESAGLVRDLKRWTKSSIGSVAMGHEISTTTLQLARACAVIANGGLLVAPRLVLRRVGPGGQVREEPSVPPVRVLRPETAITMRRLMEGVVLHGTGKMARLAGYSAGGKTGTAQIFDVKTRRFTHFYNSSFMGFAPVANPAIVVVATLNGATKYGAVVAAPVFREVASTALRVMDVPRDIPDNTPEPAEEPAETNDLAIADLGAPPVEPPPPADGGVLTPVSAAAGEEPAGPLTAPVDLVGPRVPDFRGKTLRAVAQAAGEMGLPVEYVGEGIARAQTPPPGAILPRGARMRVVFTR